MTPGLSPQQSKAVELILQGKPLTEVAKACGMTLPELYDARYSLPFAEHMARRQADLAAYTSAMYLGAAREVLDIVLDIARTSDNDATRLKACAMLNERAFAERSTYTTTAEWAAAREQVTKSVMGSLWKLSDSEIVDTVRNLKALPKGD
jgi:hypothetical protein